MKAHTRIVVLGVGVLAIGVVGFQMLDIPEALAQAAAQAQPVLEPDPSTQLPENLITHEQMLEWFESMKNWGRWGADDDKGTLNLITPEKTKAAAALVREGITVRLYHFPDPVNLEEPLSDTSNMGVLNKHWMPGLNPETGVVRGALDAISFAIHDGSDTHIDALCHYVVKSENYENTPPIVYGGRPQKLTADGCMGGASIDKMGAGYVTRGILIDFALMTGVEYVEKRKAFYTKDLEEWEKFAGVKIGSGDAVFVHTGRWIRRAKEGPWNYRRESPGLHASVLPWLKERDIAILGGDGVNDVQPSGVAEHNRPIHDTLMPIWGTPTIDNGDFTELAEVAARLKRWEFMVSWTMMQVPNGTATPFMGSATF